MHVVCDLSPGIPDGRPGHDEELEKNRERLRRKIDERHVR